jgi:hypothetical protein
MNGISALTKLFPAGKAQKIISHALREKDFLYRGLDLEKDVLQCPDYLQEAYEAGKELALAIPE